MSAPRDFDGIVREWLESGPTLLSERAFDAALAEVHQTRQRRPIRLTWRLSAMNMPARLAAVAVIGVLAVGAALLVARPGQPVVGVPSPAPGLIASPSAPASPWASPSPSVVPPRAPSWTPTGSMVTPREGHTATLLPDGGVLVTGGLNRTSGNPNGTVLASAELYDPGSGTWSATESMSTARENHTATLLPDGKVLVVGGFTVTSGNPNGTTLASAELYDPATGTWSATGSMSTARESHTATLLPDGKVLVVGGYTVTVLVVGGSTVTTPQPRDSAELYDPASGTWTATGKMVLGRAPARGGTATLLPDGKVLVAGGNSSSGSFGGIGSAGDTSELYDPSKGTWTAAGKMVAARGRSMATLLPDGKVLVAGGGLDAAGRASELFDPSTGSWTATGTMVAGHSNGAATLLADGKVLVAGGGSPTLPAAELYDPGTGSWTATAKMVAVRVNHTATLLADGKVLVAGGGDRFHTLASAELYDPGSP